MAQGVRQLPGIAGLNTFPEFSGLEGAAQLAGLIRHPDDRTGVGQRGQELARKKCGPGTRLLGNQADIGIHQ